MKNRYMIPIILILFSVFSFCSDNIQYTIKFKDVPEKLTLKIYNSNQKLMDVYDEIPYNLALSYKKDVYNCHIYNNDIEIYNFLLKENTLINNTGIPKIKYIQNNSEDRYYRLYGMYMDLKINDDIIPGPILYTEFPQIDIFDKNGRVQLQSLTDVTREFNSIYEGFSKVSIRVKWDSAPSDNMYILHTLSTRTPKYTKLENKGDYFEFFSIMPYFSAEDDFNHWYQIICDQKSSPKYPVINYMKGDYDINHDFDSYLNEPLYRFSLDFYMLPINKWDKIIIKHNFFPLPENFQGLDRQLMELVDKRRMKFHFQADSRKGLKFFEIWAEDIETGEFRKIYSTSIYLDKNIKFEYDYDNKPEKNILEKIFPYFILIVILTFIFPYLKKFLLLYLNRLSKRSFESIFSDVFSSNDMIVVAQYNGTLWEWICKYIPNVYIYEKDTSKIEKVYDELQKLIFKENILIHINSLNKDVLEILKEISNKEGVRFYVLCDNIKDNIKTDIRFEILKEDHEEYLVKYKDNILKIYIKDDQVLRWDKETSKKNLK